jgi:hypothetical protein
VHKDSILNYVILKEPGQAFKLASNELETCRECGGAVKVMACIEDPVVIEKILTHLNEKAASATTGLLPESRAPP